MASLDEPTTWQRYGDTDEELAAARSHDKARFPAVDLKDLPNIRQAWADGCREDMLSLLAEHQNEVSMEELPIPLLRGTTIRSLVFKPRSEPLEPRPLLVLIHGGGFLFGTAEMEAPACINSVVAHGCVALSLDYSLAPEEKFPVYYEEIWEALQWITTTSASASLGVNLEFGFILGGTSSGGQTTAALSHWARDRGLSPPLTGLYMNCAFTIQPEMLSHQFQSIYQSRQPAGDGASSGLSQKTELAFKEAVQPDLSSKLWSPLLWPSGHSNLPRTYFQVCGADVLRDDSLVYERTLRLDAGVETKVDVYTGMPHVWWFSYPEHSATKKFYLDTVNGIGWLLRKV